jgi:PST family polysaccharide transporter
MAEQYAAGVPVIRILSLLPFIVAMSNVFGIQIMVNFGLQQLLTRILLAAGVLNLVLALLLAGPLKHVGVALTSLTTEIVVTTVMFAALQKNGLHVFRALGKDIDKPQTVA